MFRPHLNTTFSVASSEGARLPLLLARVTEGPADEHIEQFSLMFHAAAGAALPHGTYAFEHPAAVHLTEVRAALVAAGVAPTYSNAAPDANMSTGGIVVGGGATAANTGGGQAHANMQPYLAMTYCIALQGIFPTQG